MFLPCRNKKASKAVRTAYHKGYLDSRAQKLTLIVHVVVIDSQQVNTTASDVFEYNPIPIVDGESPAISKFSMKFMNPQISMIGPVLKQQNSFLRLGYQIRI
jgi:hypothetical protein